MNDALFDTFLNDAALSIERLEALLHNLERSEKQETLLQEAFRHVHSIKSEASYLALDTLAGEAHIMEEQLEPLRTGEKRVEAGTVNSLYHGLDKVKAHLSIVAQNREPSREELEIRQVFESSEEKEEGLRGLSERILTEALRRGERFYKLVCSLHRQTPMPYMKAFLVLNNLEKIVNVIRSEPDLRQAQPEVDYGKPVFYFTASCDLKEIYRAVDVDQVSGIEIVQLPYGRGFLPEHKMRSPEAYVPVESRYEGMPVTVQAGELDEISDYLREIENWVRRVGEQTGGEVLPKGPKLAALREMTESLESLLRRLRMVNVERQLTGYYRFVRAQSQALGKEIALTIHGGEVKADRRVMAYIAEPLMQLVRNAISHGIETPEERRSSGKPETASIKISFRKKEDRLLVSVEDDGRGIDGDGQSRDELLSKLVRPGYSTAPDASLLAGRGVGLDAVYRAVSSLPGGKLSLETEIGKGTGFTMDVPAGYTPLLFVAFRDGERTLFLPKKFVRGIEPIEREALHARAEEGSFYRDAPLFTVNGRLAVKEAPDAGQCIRIAYQGREAWLLVDEILVERELSEGSFSVGEETAPYLSTFSLNGKLQEALLLNPALINQA